MYFLSQTSQILTYEPGVSGSGRVFLLWSSQIDSPQNLLKNEKVKIDDLNYFKITNGGVFLVEY